MSIQISPASRCELVVTAGALHSLEHEWADLFDRCPDAPPFLHPAWQLTWWDIFGSAPLKTIALRRDNRLVALAACFEYDQRLVFIGNGISDQLGVLGEDHQAAEQLNHALAQHRLDLQEIPHTSSLLHFPHSECSVCPTVDLRAETPKNMRKTLKVGRKYLDSRGRVSTHQSTSADFLDDLFRLHRARWQQRGEQGVLADSRVEAFHRKAADGLSRAGMLRMYALVVDSAVIGVVYAFARNGAVYSYLGGFDPQWQDGSPGALSIALAIEDARSRGDRFFDFLRGPEKYKYLWGAEDRRQFRIFT